LIVWGSRRQQGVTQGERAPIHQAFDESNIVDKDHLPQMGEMGVECRSAMFTRNGSIAPDRVSRIKLWDLRLT
jgi:hypothetical protein